MYRLAGIGLTVTQPLSASLSIYNWKYCDLKFYEDRRKYYDSGITHNKQYRSSRSSLAMSKYFEQHTYIEYSGISEDSTDHSWLLEAYVKPNKKS